MILQKEFYFVRHGQTNHNLLEGKHKSDYLEDMPLNETGKNQAQAITSIISSLPIQTVCSSPLKRALETKEIISLNLEAPHYKISDLHECSSQIWQELMEFKIYSSFPKGSLVMQFADRIRNGINQALSLPGPSLVVAHGGVHFALCSLLEIENHEWAIGNCVPVHFFIENGKWRAKKLS